jgi:c-di-GMP-binding flagellar brake protein YcgR
MMSAHSSGESLDFNNLNGTDLEPAARQFFRVSIDERNDCFVKIEQTKYRLVDMSVNGVSFYTKSGKKFPIGTVLSGCELTLNNESIKGLKGRIVHNSSEPVHHDHNIETEWLCGMIWDDNQHDKKELIELNFEFLKKGILSENVPDDIGE